MKSPEITKMASSLPKDVNLLKDRAWIEIDQEALKHNVAYLESCLQNPSKIMPVLKANAYGHGAIEIARLMEKYGYDLLAVACLSEAIELKEAGIKADILILGYTHVSNVSILEHYHLIQNISSFEYAKEICSYAKKVRCHISVDTGMHRLGLSSNRIDEIEMICNMPQLQVEGIFSHLCASDGDDEKAKVYTLAQAKAFETVIKQLEKDGYAIRYKHLLASNGIIKYANFAGDFGRAGIALYGLLNTRTDYENHGQQLKPILSIHARITAIKQLHKGEYAGYGLAYQAEKDMQIAAISIGYVDGINRRLSCQKGKIIVQGIKVPIIGRICMDQLLVDITGIDAKLHEEVVLIGKQKDAEITVYDYSDWLDTITVDVVSTLSRRLPVIVK